MGGRGWVRTGGEQGLSTGDLSPAPNTPPRQGVQETGRGLLALQTLLRDTKWEDRIGGLVTSGRMVHIEIPPCPRTAGRDLGVSTQEKALWSDLVSLRQGSLRWPGSGALMPPIQS